MIPTRCSIPSTKRRPLIRPDINSAAKHQLSFKTCWRMLRLALLHFSYFSLGNPGNITLPFEGFDLRRMSRMVQFNCRGSLKPKCFVLSMLPVNASINLPLLHGNKKMQISCTQNELSSVQLRQYQCKFHQNASKKAVQRSLDG